MCIINAVRSATGFTKTAVLIRCRKYIRGGKGAFFTRCRKPHFLPSILIILSTFVKIRQHAIVKRAICRRLTAHYFLLRPAPINSSLSRSCITDPALYTQQNAFCKIKSFHGWGGYERSVFFSRHSKWIFATMELELSMNVTSDGCLVR